MATDDKADLVIAKQLGMRARKIAGSHTMRNSAAALVITDSDEMGLALVEETGEIQFWGLLSPINVVQFYRAMQLLDTVNTVGDWLLSACYYAAARKPSAHGEGRIEFLEFNGSPDIRKTRREILRRPIPQEDFDDILRIANEHNLPISGWELKNAIKARDIQCTDMVEMFIQRERILESQCQIKSYLAKKMMPLPKDVSFQAFCQRTGLDNICDGPLGAYGFDWGHHQLDELDEEIVRCSLEELPFFLFCSQFPADSERQFGTIGTPAFDTDNGRVVMEKVMYNHQEGMMDVEITSTSGISKELIDLRTFESLHPKLVGIAQYKIGKGYHVMEVKLVLPKKTPLKPEKHSIKEYIKQVFGRTE